MNFKLISSLAQLGIYREQWNSVDSLNPFNSWEWNYCRLKYLEENVQPAVIVLLGDSNQWIGIAPYCIERKPYRKCKLRFIGSGNSLPGAGVLIAHPDRYADIADEITRLTFDSIHNNQVFKGIDEIELDGVCSDDVNMSYFIDRMMVEGFDCLENSREGTLKLRLDLDWATFSARLDPIQSRKLDWAETMLAQGNINVRSSRCDAFYDLWHNFIELGNGRRKLYVEPGDVANHQEQSFSTFLYHATRSLAARGRAELVEIQYEQRPLASMLILNDGQSALMLQVETDVERKKFDAKYLLLAHAIRSSLENGYEYFDFLGDDESHQSNWNATQSAVSKLHLIPDRFLARIKFRVRRSGQSMRRLIGQWAGDLG